MLTMRTYSQGTDIWKRATEGVTITAYQPPFTSQTELDIIEPDQVITLPEEERARMNRAPVGAVGPFESR